MQFIKVETEGHVTTVTLDRPEVMNAINPPMHHELQAAFDAFAADPEQFICVVTGAGEKAFCAGSDLKAAVAAGGAGRAYPRCGYAGLIERFDLAKPVIAAVNGLALGGGFEVVLACDIVIAAGTASFGLPEPRVGAVALGGGVHRLARQIGLKKAMGYILTCARMSAREAESLGLVNEVVAPGELRAATERWCAEILKGAPMSIRASKEAVMRGLDEPSLAAAMQGQNDYPAFAAWREAEDTKEGPRAFAEKRAPVWKGR
jgi:crotonobetainyl-CoA hydratase